MKIWFCYLWSCKNLIVLIAKMQHYRCVMEIITYTSVTHKHTNTHINTHAQIRAHTPIHKKVEWMKFSITATDWSGNSWLATFMASSTCNNEVPRLARTTCLYWAFSLSENPLSWSKLQIGQSKIAFSRLSVLGNCSIYIHFSFKHYLDIFWEKVLLIKFIHEIAGQRLIS